MKVLAKYSAEVSRSIKVDDVDIWIEGVLSDMGGAYMLVGEITVNRQRVMEAVESAAGVPVSHQFIDSSRFAWAFENWVRGVLIPEYVSGSDDIGTRRVEATVSAKIGFQVTLEPVEIPIYPDVEVQVAPVPEVKEDLAVSVLDDSVEITIY